MSRQEYIAVIAAENDIEPSFKLFRMCYDLQFDSVKYWMW